MLLIEPNVALIESKTDWFVDTRQSSCIVRCRSPCVSGYGDRDGFAWIHVVGIVRTYLFYINPNYSLDDFLRSLDDLTSFIYEAIASKSFHLWRF